ncbi:hypothetical protein FHS85_002448 [Rhodoligotrophos appendicifer]|uniref:short-chain dehydrogenase/reductase n=1 Tax=Rhodoligotrophos appendicifer TaxID=987056 RepID=UPI00118700F3|nr:short-chain dehydrogenase/reductase [Rhodoligotrophos appendicifer]
MDLQLKGKRAIVTGAGKGIGKAVAEALAREGCDLTLVARTKADLEILASSLQENFGVKAFSHTADLSNPEDRSSIAEKCRNADILINNAGSIPGGEIDEISDQTWRSAWDLKVFGYIDLTRLLYTTMKARGDGVIVNIIGSAGERLNPLYIAGSTGNAGLIAFTRALGARSADFGVRVLGVNPGLTATERATTLLRTWSMQKYGTPDRWAEVQRDMHLPFGRMATPEELADVVTFMASPRASYVSGTVVTVDGGASNRHS